ncbi:MAG: HAD-IA family hydrolase [Candidatus Thorarchaeota archaeon]|nr:HAD-IA family hydrolase [Candidatus Thorarchaeota archaeon]
MDTIIFDLGGTLYEPLEGLVSVARRHLIDAGIEECEDLTDDEIENALDTQRRDWLIQYMRDNNVEPHWEPTRYEWIKYDRMLLEVLCIDGDLDSLAATYQDKWDAFHQSIRPKLIDGCKEGLARMSADGYKLGIASNRFGDPSTHLETDEIKQYFGAIEYTAVPGYAKPSPYMLLEVARALGSNPHRCAYVGNIVEHDVVSANRAGMVPILLTWIDSEQRDLAPEGTVIIDHIWELEEMLKPLV